MNTIESINKSLILLTALLFHTCTISAQENKKANGGPNYVIQQYTFSNGGGVMTDATNNVYRVTDSIGQIAAGHQASSTDGINQFFGGFFVPDIDNNDIIFKNGFE